MEEGDMVRVFLYSGSMFHTFMYISHYYSEAGGWATKMLLLILQLS